MIHGRKITDLFRTKDIKSFIIGFLTAIIIFTMLGFKSVEIGSVEWKPVYVKIVD
tara:strand:+ start:15440 stop:15604 length:165 start_codon:yes stop_codon:yes gene_type:complete